MNWKQHISAAKLEEYQRAGFSEADIEAAVMRAEAAADTVFAPMYFDPENVPKRKPELIKGVLRKGHKAVLSAPSKAGKSVLALELALAVAQGQEWIGIQCAKGRVLYCNLEIDTPDFLNRIYDQTQTFSWAFTERENLILLNWRGKAEEPDEMIDELAELAQRQKADLLIIDPVFKILGGVDENSAGDVAGLLRKFDRIMTDGCSLFLVHHYAKGGGRGRDQIDRASGSGVFARDPDAIITMSEAMLDAEAREALDIGGDAAFMVEFSLRSFKQKPPVGVYFRYPIHVVDDGLLKYAMTPRKRDYQREFNRAYAASTDKKISELSKALEVTPKTIRDWLRTGRVKGYAVANSVISRTMP